MRPSVATVTILEQGRVQLVLELNAEAWLAEIPPSVSDTDDALNAPIYDALRVLTDEAIAAQLISQQRAFIQTVDLWTDQGRLPLAIQRVEVFPEPDMELPRIS